MLKFIGSCSLAQMSYSEYFFFVISSYVFRGNVLFSDFKIWKKRKTEQSMALFDVYLVAQADKMKILRKIQSQ